MPPAPTSWAGLWPATREKVDKPCTTRWLATERFGYKQARKQWSTSKQKPRDEAKTVWGVKTPPCNSRRSQTFYRLVLNLWRGLVIDVNTLPWTLLWLGRHQFSCFVVFRDCFNRGIPSSTTNIRYLQWVFSIGVSNQAVQFIRHSSKTMQAIASLFLTMESRFLLRWCTSCSIYCYQYLKLTFIRKTILFLM